MTRTTDACQPAWQAQSVLLSYPDEELIGRLPLLRQVAAAAGGRIGGPLHRFLDHADGTPLPDLAADYVATFDHRKRCCLFLTYYSYGDTRKRGIALLRLKQSYAAAGLRLTEDELPDHLTVVLEFAAIASVGAGKDLLCRHRAGLELLRLALNEAASPWASVLESVSATLPPLRGGERQAIARLAAEGPPEEQVGLEPFAPPEYMPQPQGGTR
jgi:nitrate reductase molybdenum cofactor assembly chaperone NarJ/NarW